MSRLVAFLQSLGGSGATRNAGLLGEDRRRERMVVEALAAAVPAPPGAAAARAS
jgi:hypothetical protein